MYSASSSTPILYYNPSPKELSLSNVLNFILFQLNIYFPKGASLRGELNIVGRQGTQQSDRYVNIQSWLQEQVINLLLQFTIRKWQAKSKEKKVDGKFC